MASSEDLACGRAQTPPWPPCLRTRGPPPLPAASASAHPATSMLQSPSICCSFYLHGVTDRRGGPSWRPDAIHVELRRPASEGRRRMCPLTGSAAQLQPVTRVRILLQQLPTLSIAQLGLDLLAGRLRTQASRRPKESRTFGARLLNVAALLNRPWKILLGLLLPSTSCNVESGRCFLAGHWHRRVTECSKCRKRSRECRSREGSDSGTPGRPLRVISSGAGDLARSRAARRLHDCARRPESESEHDSAPTIFCGMLWTRHVA